MIPSNDRGSLRVAAYGPNTPAISHITNRRGFAAGIALSAHPH
jgi:hypothetical protein